MVGWEELQKCPVRSQQEEFTDLGLFEQPSSSAYSSVDVRCCSGIHGVTDPFLFRYPDGFTATAVDAEASDFDDYYRPFITPLQVGQFYPPLAAPEFPFWDSQPFGDGQMSTPFQSPTSVTTSNTSIASPFPRRLPSFSLSDGSPISTLETVAYIVPSSSSAGSDFDTGSDVDGSRDWTIEKRINALNDSAQHQLRTCSRDPKIQDVVLAIHESQEFQDKEDLPFKVISPLLEPQGRGRRGAPQAYRCRWDCCGEIINRRLHAKEHVMVHLEYRRHVCADCGSAFVRKNELNKHQKPCKKIKERNVPRSAGDVRRTRTNPITKKHAMTWKMTPRHLSKAGSLPLSEFVNAHQHQSQSPTAYEKESTQGSQASPRGNSPTYALNSYHQPTPTPNTTLSSSHGHLANVAYYSSNVDLV